jgi:hypothetical protein
MSSDVPKTVADEFDFDDIGLATGMVAGPTGKEAEVVSSSLPAPAQQRQVYDPRIARDRKDLEGKLKEVADAAMKQYMTKVGASAALFTAKATIRVGIKSKPGASKVIEDIFGRILTPTGAEGTQSAIRHAVQVGRPGFTVPKDWTKPLPAWATARLRIRVQCSGIPFNTIEAPAGITLSQLHAAAKSAYLRHRDGSSVHKATISISNDAVFVNMVRFSVSENQAKGKSYKIVRMNVATLERALLGKV